MFLLYCAVGYPPEPSWITCSPCPDQSTTFNAFTKAFDYGTSVNNCYCTAGTYATEEGCSGCPRAKTSPPNAQSSSECTLTDSAKLMAIVIPAGAVLFGFAMVLMYQSYQKKLEKLLAEKRRQMQEKVNDAAESVNFLAHPLILVTGKWFLEAGRMIKHEDARAQGCLWTIDTMEELKGFKKGKTLIFLSHQWLAWAEPDPQRAQYKAMAKAFHSLVEDKHLDLANTFVWLDYTSIPQTHRGLQMLSINSLTNYSGACDYFIIVA